MTRLGRLLGLVLLLAAVGSSTVVYLRWKYREQRYNQLIEQIAVKYGVDKFLIKAVMRQESGFDPFALSSAGAIGLMQVMPGTGEQWAHATGRTNFTRAALWNERCNLEAGTWYLARALRRWQAMDDPVPFALAEYNAGPGNVAKWLPHGAHTSAEEFRQAIRWPGVRSYVEKIADYREAYRANGRL